MKPRYLGDAVYAQLDTLNRLVLSTDSHIRLEAGAWIILEPEVIQALRQYLDSRDDFLLNGEQPT
jgi:hypothetical protein